MKSAFRGSQVTIFFRLIKQKGFFHAIKASMWRLRMAWLKLHISFQDRYAWYRYPDWIRENEPSYPLPAAKNDQPQISLLIFGSSLSYVKDTIDSLQSQSYSCWKAYVFFEDSDSLSLFLSSYSQEPRIHGRISQGNPLLSVAEVDLQGDWMSFLNSGDTFASDGLAFFVSEMEAHPEARIIYSDSDCLSPDGKTRHHPSFWPDYSPELLLSVNYLRRALFHREILLSHANKSANLEAALLCGIGSPSQVIHIPRVLCHTRDEQPSFWPGDVYHPQTLATFLEFTGRKEIKYKTSPITSTPQFTWSFGHPLISIIILTRDQAALLEQCIESILQITTYNHFEIILVENNSRENETFSYYQRLKDKTQVRLLVHNQEFNYSAFNNWGASHARGDLLLFINNDIECVDPEWLEEMARWASRPDIGIVGAKLLYPNRTIQHAGLVIGLEGHANHVFSGCREGYTGLFGSPEWYRDYSAVTGACMMLRKEVFEQMGGFDEAYTLAFNDVELCVRAIQAGYRVVYTPFARAIHHEGATRSTYKPPSDIKLASHHLRQLIEHGDPYFNPNLSLTRRTPTFHRRNEPPPLQKLDWITKYLG
jgi:GT2 family glycosyltransferase